MKPAPVPSVIILGPHTYEVRTDVESIRQLRAEERRGDSFADLLYLRLDTDLPRTSLAETLLHEAMHIAWHQAGVTDSDDEERTVTALAPRLLELLRRNPEVVAYLTSND